MNIIRISKKICPSAFIFIILLSEAAVAMPPKGKEEESPFGVLEFMHWDHDWNCHKYPDRKSLERAAALMKEAGIGIVRFDFLWEDIEPTQGKFNFEKYDLIVEVLSKCNIKILGILDYCASWAAGSGEWNSLPRENRLFINYAVRVISRYKDKVKYWEVWNEPDSSTYLSKQDGLKSYCAFLKEVYPAAKLADPDCKILNGGLALGLTSVNRLYDNGAQNYFDILNIHVFENPLYPGRAKAVAAYPKMCRKVMVRKGDAEKEIWITEIGCPGVKRGVDTADWWLGKNPNEKQQAQWVKDVYAELLKQKIASKIFWAFFRDCNGHWGSGIDYFGLVRWDFSLKPAYNSYRECYGDWRNNTGRSQKSP